MSHFPELPMPFNNIKSDHHYKNTSPDSKNIKHLGFEKNINNLSEAHRQNQQIQYKNPFKADIFNLKGGDRVDDKLDKYSHEFILKKNLALITYSVNS